MNSLLQQIFSLTQLHHWSMLKFVLNCSKFWSVQNAKNHRPIMTPYPFILLIALDIVKWLWSILIRTGFSVCINECDVNWERLNCCMVSRSSGLCSDSKWLCTQSCFNFIFLNVSSLKVRHSSSEVPLEPFLLIFFTKKCFFFFKTLF